MKKNSYLYLLTLNLKSNRIKKIIFVFLFFLIFLIGNILLNGNYIIADYIFQSLNGSLEEKTINVYNQNLNYEDTILDLKNYDEISEIYNLDYNTAVVSLDILNDKPILLKPVSSNVKNIIYGKKIKNDDEIICPVSLGSIESVKTNQLVNLKKYLNKYINISYNSYYYYSSSISDRKVNNSYSKKLKLVGLYIPEKNILNSTYLECYMNENEIIKISQESKDSYSEQFLAKNSISDNGTSTTVILKDKNNIDKLKNKLEKNGYIVDKEIFEVDSDLIKMIQLISKSGFIVMFMFIILILFLYINNIIHDEKYNIGLYKSFGFNNFCISRIINLQVYTLVLFSYLISIIFLLLLTKVINLILSQYIVFMNININLSIVNEIFYFCVIFFVTYCCTKLTLKKIVKIQAKDILNENNN